MPYRIHHYPSEAFVAVELSGVVRWYDVLSVFSEVFKRVSWRRGYRALWDARALESMDLPPQELLEIASSLRSLSALSTSGRSAFLVRGADRRAAELIAAYARSPAHGIAVVEELEAALAYLGLPALPGAGDEQDAA